MQNSNPQEPQSTSNNQELGEYISNLQSSLATERNEQESLRTKIRNIEQEYRNLKTNHFENLQRDRREIRRLDKDNQFCNREAARLYYELEELHKKHAALEKKSAERKYK